MLVEPRIHCLCVVHLASNIYPQQRARLNLVRANLGDFFLAHANLGVFFWRPPIWVIFSWRAPTWVIFFWRRQLYAGALAGPGT